MSSIPFIFTKTLSLLSRLKDIDGTSFTKSKSALLTLLDITIMIHIFSHAYNILINENKHLPKLERWWSCSKRKLRVWRAKEMFLKILEMLCVFMGIKIWFFLLFIGPSSHSYPSLGIKYNWYLVNEGRMGHLPLGLCLLSSFWASNWAQLHISI